MSARVLAYTVSWAETRAYSADLEIPARRLAEWTLASLPLHALGQVEPRVPSVDELTSSLERNPHLFSRIAQQYAAAQHLLQTVSVSHAQPLIEAQPPARHKKTKSAAEKSSR